MGKVKRRKIKQRSAECDDEFLGETLQNSRETVVQTILDQLQAADIEEQLCGLQTISLLIEEKNNINYILEQDIIKTISPLLISKNKSVRNETAGFLRNFSTINAETCEALVEQDIMTSLTSYFYEVAENFIPNKRQKSNDEVICTFLNCANLLWNLCENSEVAVKCIENSRILDILLNYLDVTKYNNNMVIVVLQILLVITEDSPNISGKVKNISQDVLHSMLILDNVDSSTQLIKVLAAGVVLNVCKGDLDMLSADVTNQIISSLAGALTNDHLTLCKQISSDVPLVGLTEIGRPNMKGTKDLENRIEQMIHLLDAKQSAVEIITNLCSFEGDEESMEQSESSDIEEECDENILNHEGEIINEDKLPLKILDGIAVADIFSRVWDNTQMPPENVLLILKESSNPIYKKLNNLQMGALFCINNMLTVLPLDMLGGINGVYKIWIEAGKVVFKQSSDNVNVIESATAVMRAALDKLKSKENETAAHDTLFTDLSLTDIQLMLNGIKESQVPEVRSNLIRMIGILALLLTNKMNDSSCIVICAIAEFILEQASKENEVWVLAEALDTLVDLFSEDETDVLAAKINLVDKLVYLGPILKNKFKNQRRLPAKQKVLVETVTSNLPRFIKYKKKQISKIVT